MTDTKTTFDHKGIQILMTETGRFYADTANGRVMASSVAGLRKKIDKATVFEPFKAFTIEGYRNKRLETFTVTGIEKRRGYPGLKFRTDRGGNKDSVYEDTPANRKIAKQYLDADKAFETLSAKHDADQDKLISRIDVRKPEAVES